MRWSSFTPLAAGALLTLGGAWRVSEAGGEGWTLLILGAVCLGAWLALHARDKE
jgi:hypothetical protein